MAFRDVSGRQRRDNDPSHGADNDTNERYSQRRSFECSQRPGTANQTVRERFGYYADNFSQSETAGNVAPQRRADLVLLDANPLADIRNLERVRAVVVAGRFLDRKELDALLARAKETVSRQ